MFKLIVAFAILLAVSSQVLKTGSYVDRPELLGDSSIKPLISYAAEQIALKDNLILDNIKVTRVQTQLVAGLNYKLDFTAQPVNGIDIKQKTCQAIIYVRFDSTKSFTSGGCQ